MMLLLFLIFRLILTVEGVPVLTIHSPDGDLVDCIKLEEQRAFDHPLLKNHVIQTIPTDLPYTAEKEEEYGWQIWHQNGTRCPKGSVPVRRVTSHPNGIPSSSLEERATGGHEYAFGITGKGSNISIYGTQFTTNIFRPKIEGSEEFSLGQTWLTTGSYETNDLNAIEAGWQVYPRLYHDYQPRFFTFWTMDSYNTTRCYNTRCYNTRCPGFVQTSTSIMVEGAFNETSIVGGTQVDLTIRIWKDQKLECWWLGVVVAHGVVVPVGYWPSSIFTHLADQAYLVKWGGEIINDHPTGRHTRTQMGSGGFPEGGFRYAAYMRNLEIVTDEKGFQPVQDLHIGATDPSFYRANLTKPIRHDFGTHFYYGGSEYFIHSHATAFQLSLDSFLIFVCFSLFWFV